MIYFNITFSLSCLIFALYMHFTNKSIKQLYKTESYLIEEVKNLNIKGFEIDGLMARNTNDIKTLLSLVNVGVDVNMRSGSWAVICVNGKPEYIRFVDLGKSDVREIAYFLRRYDGANKIIDGPFCKF